MEYTVQKLAQMAGVSSRTLRYYDEIGILKLLTYRGIAVVIIRNIYDSYIVQVVGAGTSYNHLWNFKQDQLKRRKKMPSSRALDNRRYLRPIQ